MREASAKEKASAAAKAAAEKAAAEKAAAERAAAERAAEEARRNRYSPALAKEDVNIGKFYRNKGSEYAAISRFKSAARHDPRWPLPYELLGETYEKKNDTAHAIAAYRKYLKLAPRAKNAKDIQKRVEKLARKVNR